MPTREFLECHFQSVRHNTLYTLTVGHYNVVTWKRFPHNWPFAWVIYQSGVGFPHKVPVNAELFCFSFVVNLNKLLNKQLGADDLRRLNRRSCDVTFRLRRLKCVMLIKWFPSINQLNIKLLVFELLMVPFEMYLSFLFILMLTPKWIFHIQVNLVLKHLRAVSTGIVPV